MPLMSVRGTTHGRVLDLESVVDARLLETRVNYANRVSNTSDPSAIASPAIS